MSQTAMSLKRRSLISTSVSTAAKRIVLNNQITANDSFYAYSMLYFFSVFIYLPLCLSLWHTLLERSHVRNQTPVFSRGCLLPRTGRTDVQWSQIQFNGSEPRVVGSSWRSFPVWWRLANHSSNCMMMVFAAALYCSLSAYWLWATCLCLELVSRHVWWCFSVPLHLLDLWAHTLRQLHRSSFM